MSGFFEDEEEDTTDYSKFLDSLHRRDIILPVTLLSSFSIVLAWILWFFVPVIANIGNLSDIDRGSILLLIVVVFLPVFIAGYCIGNLLFPAVEDSSDVESGFMAGFATGKKLHSGGRFLSRQARQAQQILFCLSFFLHNSNFTKVSNAVC